MDLNFGIKKILLFLPTRFDQYNTGPGSDINILTDTIKKIGKNNTNKMSVIDISKNLFINT